MDLYDIPGWENMTISELKNYVANNSIWTGDWEGSPLNQEIDKVYRQYLQENSVNYGFIPRSPKYIEEVNEVDPHYVNDVNRAYQEDLPFLPRKDLAEISDEVWGTNDVATLLDEDIKEAENYWNRPLTSKKTPRPDTPAWLDYLNNPEGNTQNNDFIGPPVDPNANINRNNQKKNTSGKTNWASIAAIAGQASSDIANLATDVTANSVKERKEQLLKTTNSLQMKPQTLSYNNDNVISDWNKIGKINHVNKKDLGYRSFGQSFGKALTSGISSFGAGMSTGNPWAAAGMAVGSTFLNAIGSIVNNNRAKKATTAVNNAIDYTNNFNMNSKFNRAFNASRSDLSTRMSNFKAFGGDIGGPAVEYDFMNRFLNAKENSSTGYNTTLNSLPNSFMKAAGGPLNTHGGIFSNGVMNINNGGTHEENPLEGVPMGQDREGTPNLVEEGETIYNDYVFSNRIKVPKKLLKKYKLGGKLSFAEASKKLSKESEERPNDPISKKGLDDLMAMLRQDQEEVKARQMMKEIQQLPPEQQQAIMSQGMRGMQGMQEMQPEMGMEQIDQQMPQQVPQEIGMEQMTPQFAFGGAFGGKVNKFLTGGAADPDPNPDQTVPYSYGENAISPEKGSLVYSPNFDFGDKRTFMWYSQPLWANGHYTSAYLNPEFYEWLKTEAALKLQDEWWKDVSNAPNYWGKWIEKEKKYSKNNSTPTFKQIWGDSFDELIGAKDYLLSDYHKYALYMYDQWMRSKGVNPNDVLPKEKYMIAGQPQEDGTLSEATEFPEMYQRYEGAPKGIYWDKFIEDKYKFLNKVYDEATNTYINYYNPKKQAESGLIVKRGLDGKIIGEPIDQEAFIRSGESSKYAPTQIVYTDKNGKLNTVWDEVEAVKEGKYAPWLRYAPALGFGLASISDAFGWTNRPDFSAADALLEAASTPGQYKEIKFKPVSQYLSYNPFDRDYAANQLRAQSAASRRALLQNAGLNRATGMAGILASDYNSGIQTGNMIRQGLEYNLAQKQQYAEFNRGTDTTNSQGALSADQANQNALASMREWRLNGMYNAYNLREQARIAAETARSHNISGVFDSLGKIGMDEYAQMMRDKVITTSGIPGGDAYSRGKTGTETQGTKTVANGGRIRRKKKGLTI